MDTAMNTDKAHAKSHTAIDKTAAGAQKRLDKFTGVATPAIEKVAARVHKAVDKLFGAAAPAAGWIDAKTQNLNKSRLKAVENGKKYVHDYPFATIGAAVAAGALIALFMRSRGAKPAGGEQ